MKPYHLEQWVLRNPDGSWGTMKWVMVMGVYPVASSRNKGRLQAMMKKLNQKRGWPHV
jgi:hypothetical protein